jgi:hypothetical protein
MNYLKIGIVLLLLSSCGGSGHIIFYDFNYSKFVVQNELNRVINKDSGYSVPHKWIDCYKAAMPGDMFLYFKQNPEEMYEISFNGDPEEWQKSPVCRLALIYQFDGDRWRKDSELRRIEKDRICKRFEAEILSKIRYGYSRSN